MSLLPSFEIGLWNAWILMLFVILHPRIMALVDKAVGTGDMFAKMGGSPPDEAGEKASKLPTLLLYALFGCSIFLPLRLGTPWFYLGLASYLVGIAIFMSALVIACKTPAGCLFSQGMYRFSRHPLYLSFMVILLGVSVASLSWLFLLLSAGWLFIPFSQVNAEERGCLDRFGDAYQDYMNRTPKWIGIPGRKMNDT